MDKYDELLEKADVLEKKLNEFVNNNVCSLRDYYAGQVLAGMGEHLMKTRDDLNSVAKTCYKIADAMIEVRNEKK